MLDHSGQAEANEDVQRTKEKLREIFQRNYTSKEELEAAVAPLRTESIIRALDKIKSPIDALARLYELIRKFKSEIQEAAYE